MKTLLVIMAVIILIQMARILIVSFGSSVPDRITRIANERGWVEEDLFIRETLKDNAK